MEFLLHMTGGIAGVNAPCTYVLGHYPHNLEVLWGRVNRPDIITAQ